MTVQELIEKLEKIEDKSMVVFVPDYFGWASASKVQEKTFSGQDKPSVTIG